jgi:hypothetical protein
MYYLGRAGTASSECFLCHKQYRRGDMVIYIDEDGDKHKICPFHKKDGIESFENSTKIPNPVYYASA